MGHGTRKKKKRISVGNTLARIWYFKFFLLASIQGFFDIYSNKQNQHLYAWRSDKFADNRRNNVQWKYRLVKTSNLKFYETSSTIGMGLLNRLFTFFNLLEFKTVPERDFQLYVLNFLDGDTLGEYASANAIDSHRLNRWLAIGNFNPVTFFNYGYLTCFTNNTNTESIFGYSGIIQTATSKLSVLSKMMLCIDGIVETRGSQKLSCVSEKTSETEEDSDEVLDVQRLVNLYWFLRSIYMIEG